MTYQTDCTLPKELLEQIVAQGLDAVPEMIRTIINTAMQLERQEHLGAGPYERTLERRGYANGFKPKTVATRMGKITFSVPQVRDGNFYPQSLEEVVKRIDFSWEQGFLAPQDYVTKRSQLQQEMDSLRPVDYDDLMEAADLLEKFANY